MRPGPLARHLAARHAVRLLVCRPLGHDLTMPAGVLLCRRCHRTWTARSYEP